MESLIEQQHNQEEGTNVRKFLARRGAVLVRETRDTGSVSGIYRDVLLISTSVLAIVKKLHKDMSYGVRIERQDSEEKTESSVYLDYDELSELVDAFDFIRDSAIEMAKHERDYTEVTYSSKDNAKIGFFLQNGKLQYFVALESRRETCFLKDNAFQQLKEMILKAKNHLISCGASVV